MTETAPKAADTPVAEAPAVEDEEADDKAFTVPKRSLLDRLVVKGVRATIRAGMKLAGVTFNGEENYNLTKGKNTLIIANHVSYVDALFLAASMPMDAAYAIDMGVYNSIKNSKLVKYTPFRFVFNHLDLHPLDMTKPMEIRTLTKLAKAGKPVMIFPEGQRTTNGTLMQVFGGSASVAVNAEAQILPIYLDGLNFLPKSLTRLENHPSRLIPRMSVTVLPPQEIKIPEELKASKARRNAADEQLEKIMLEMPVKSVGHSSNLMDELHNTVRNFGRKYESVMDADMENPGALNFGTMLEKAYFIGKKIAKQTTKGENVGFLLPNGKAAPVTFFGMHAYGRVPTMLNAKAEKSDMVSYTETAQLKTVVTSRRFVKLAKLEEKIAAMTEKGVKITYLEDFKPVTTWQKVKALFNGGLEAKLRSRGWLPRLKDAPKGDDPAAIIFTSGSEGPPKGVVLSARNFLANIAQVHAITPILASDKLFNAMPVFHSFGLVGGMIMPILKGLKSFQFPNPLEGKTIPRVAYGFGATIMFGTDTFLDLYGRNAKDKDLAGLSRGLVFAGAERLQEKTYQTWFNRFGAQILNAYGLSEAAPGVAMNVPGAHRFGTVGRFLPGIETKFEEVPGMDGKRLYIKGPNIMLGYLKHENPGVIVPPKDGWHDTGDIVTVSPEGYVTLTGRAKRFAKIGGEMVSLDMVEALAVKASQKKDAAHAIVLRQDEANGDSLVLYTTDPLLKRDALTKQAQEDGKSILGLPKNPDIIVLAEIPKLPTGKTDYVTLTKRLKAAQASANDDKGAAPAPAVAAVAPANPQFNANAAKSDFVLSNDNQTPGVKTPGPDQPAKANGGPAL